jgi:soluble cytochrome b562
MTTKAKIARALAIVVIVLSVLSILAAAVGIVSVWRVNGPITSSLVELASLAQTGLESANAALDAVDPLLTELQRATQEVQKATEELKAGIKDSQPIINVLSALLGEDITPKIEQAAETLSTVHQAARDLNSAALAINNLPFANIEGIVEATQEFVDLFHGIESTINELDNSIAALKGDVVEGAVQPVQDLAAEAETGLAEVQGETRDLALRVESAHKTVTTVKSRIPLVIDVISLLLTLVLLWGVLAQAALIYVSWLYRQTNRLDLHRILAEQGSGAGDAAERPAEIEAAQEEAVEVSEGAENGTPEPEETGT